MTITTLTADLLALSLQVQDDGSGRAWTASGRAGVTLDTDGRIVVLDADGAPSTQDGGGRVASVQDAARELRRLDPAAVLPAVATALLERLSVRGVRLHRQDPGFELTLCLDGAPVAEVSNTGRGGAHRWSPAKGGTFGGVRVIQEQIGAAVTALTGWTSEPEDTLVSAFADAGGGITGTAALELAREFEAECDAGAMGEA